MAQATIYYLDGHQSVGTVAAWKPNSGRIDLTSDVNHSPIPIQWPLIAHVDRPVYASHLGSPHEFQNYIVTLVNGQTISGTMVSAVVTSHGVEVWHASDEAHLVERFVPWQAIRTYRLGHVPLQSGPVEDPPGLAAESADSSQEKDTSPLSLGLLEVGNARQLSDALDRSKTIEQSGFDRTLRKTIGDILVQSGVLDSEQLNTALHRKRTEPTRPIGQVLVDLGFVSEETIQRALAYKLGVPFVRLDEFDVDPKATRFIPATTAARLSVLPLMFHERRLVVALSDPSDTEALNILNFLAGYPVKYVLASRPELTREIDRYYGAAESQEAAEELEMELVETPAAQPNRQAIEKLGREKPVIRFVNSVIRDAIRQNASDIHLSPREDYVQLIYRLNGDMIPIKRFNKGMLAAAVSRIKIIGGMDITERRTPQDGRASVRWDKHDVDLRISVMPTIVGESVVIRILNTRQGLKSVDDLGFTDTDRQKFVDLIHRGQGMLLITGPTGSGKSTTLYAALHELRSKSVNILTVENPVEYHMDGIEQMQVNESAGFTFASALRNMLRHDPDIIMVGEIRDRETGQIAVQSALTGHLVLSTLHTNSAASTVMRMIDMGIEDYLISGTLNGVLAQRLVRRNCPHCIEQEVVDPWVRETLGIGADEVFYKGKGCHACHETGFSGRLAVYELMVLTPELRNMIVSGTAVDALEKQALASGMTPLTGHALGKARNGDISVAEVYRIRLS
ncbi:GspE/PulE family protein [Marinobacter sp. HL-58]|uniref:GspE/PulE family protein n=1 Tax=Marinobacter sp. HL-58 TaxID=1479237 RepID=UPI0006D949BB|nr:GspE/PulE family protein [Marinobacter sp. HL-58]KPQ01311.1 MAG: type IV pilus assembly protein PilB [Marinobacter sp. HL-58]